jgi:acetolactate synthase-1/2/3 large subunit
MKYSELAMDWLRELGYTHCFFVAGGAIMHLLDGARTRMQCIPVAHEVAAGIAAEYFNESGAEGRAFALVTAGPGVTNILTAMAGAFLESRELLVLAGQVKSADLASGAIRQRGIQEIDGVALAKPVSVEAVRIERPVARRQFVEAVMRGRQGRCGPVFIEMCLDAQGAPVERETLQDGPETPREGPSPSAIAESSRAGATIAELTRAAKRPIWLIGGGVSRATIREILPALRRTGVPLMTTWNGADRIPGDEATYLGRPNTWGQRSANVILRQADLLVAFGTRLGLQQTGFNWQEFAADAVVVQLDVDASELEKGHPRVDHPFCADANTALSLLVQQAPYGDYAEWLQFGKEVRSLLPVDEAANERRPGYINSFEFYETLARLSKPSDIIIPCSSGGANSSGLQAYEPKNGQLMIGDKGLASMGYGLAGAIGASFAHPKRRTVLVEGDGGFIQNMQELATVAVNDLNIKTFIFANEGYASIRTTQRTYFNGAYLGCDVRTGLGFPDWETLFRAFGIPLMNLGEGWSEDAAFTAAFEANGPYGFMVPIDPEQTYFPKVSSRITASGSMESRPIHDMSPDLPEDVAAKVFRYLRLPAPTGTAQ